MRKKNLPWFSILVAGILTVSCGQSDVEGEVSVDTVEEISELLVLKVRFADVLTGSDNDVKLTYIAKADAYYATDYSHIRFSESRTNVVVKGKETQKTLVRVQMSPVYLQSDPALVREEDDGSQGSGVFDIESGTGKSAVRVKDAVQKAAVLWARAEAGKEGWMKMARDSAEECVKELWLAGKQKPAQYVFVFEWANPELQDSPPSESE